VTYGDRPGEMIVTLYCWHKPRMEPLVRMHVKLYRRLIQNVAEVWRNSGPPGRRRQAVVVHVLDNLQ